MPHDDYTCKNCRYRLNNRVCSHPDSPYIGCAVAINDWCEVFAVGGANVTTARIMANKGRLTKESVMYK
jgi:hypothetical protein